MGVWSRRGWLVEKAALRKTAACRKHISSAQLGNNLIYFISSTPSLRRQIWEWNMDTEQNIKRDLIKWVIMFSLKPLMQAGGTYHHQFSTVPVSECVKRKSPGARPCEHIPARRDGQARLGSCHCAKGREDKELELLCARTQPWAEWGLVKESNVTIPTQNPSKFSSSPQWQISSALCYFSVHQSIKKKK